MQNGKTHGCTPSVRFFKGVSYMTYDILVVGGGVTGCAVARELAQYDLKVALVERAADVASNAAVLDTAVVHPGLECLKGSIKSRLTLQGSVQMEAFCNQLGVPYEPLPAMVLASSEEERTGLQQLLDWGRSLGVEGLGLKSRAWALEREPGLPETVQQVLSIPGCGLVSQRAMAEALIHDAIESGAEVLSGWQVDQVRWQAGIFIAVNSRGEEVRSSYLVNCAGLFADVINEMVGGEPFCLRPCVSEYLKAPAPEQAGMRAVLYPSPKAVRTGALIHRGLDPEVGYACLDIHGADTKLAPPCDEEQQALLRALLAQTLPAWTQVTAEPFVMVSSKVEGREEYLIAASNRVPGLVSAAGLGIHSIAVVPMLGQRVREALQVGGLLCYPKRPRRAKRK